jgi:tetratricopeptide (TPR) repeat protein
VWAASLSGQAGTGKGRLTGTVVDEAGQPIAAARIILRFLKSPTGRGFPPAWRNESAVFETVTDRKGEWAYRGLAGGIWEISASKAGYRASSRQVEVRQLSGNPHVKLRIEAIREGAYGVAADLLEKANELFAVGRFDEAAGYYRRYLDQDAGAVMVWLSLGECLEQAAKLDEAVRIFQSLVDMTSSNPLDKEITARALAGMADSLYKRGDRQIAIEYWKQAIERSPTSETVAANLANVLFSLGRDDEAISYYQKAVEIDPGRQDTRLGLAYVYLHRDEFDKARAELAKIIALQPASATAAEARKLLDEIAGKRKRGATWRPSP